MRALNPREKIIFRLTLLIIVASAVVQWVVKPLRENNDNVTDQIEAAQKRLLKSKNLIEEANSLQANYQELVAVMGKSTSEGAETSIMVAALEAAGKDAQVHIANIQPQRAANKGAVTVYYVDLMIDGSWASITKFLHSVQSKPELLNIEELNLEKIGVDSKLRGRILLSRYRVNESS